MEHVLVMRKVLGNNVLVHKPGSQERGQGWYQVADTLNLLDDFHVTGRGIGDRTMNLIKKQRKNTQLDSVGKSQKNSTCYWKKL